MAAVLTRLLVLCDGLCFISQGIIPLSPLTSLSHLHFPPQLADTSATLPSIDRPAVHGRSLPTFSFVDHFQLV